MGPPSQINFTLIPFWQWLKEQMPPL